MEKYLRKYEHDLISKGVRLTERYIAVPDNCWMCDGPRPFTNEHIFPLWLIHHYGCADEQIGSMHVDFAGNILDARGSTTFSNFTFNKICSRCNNGWMHELEEAASKIVKTKGWLALASEEPEIFARWCIKTATIINISQQRRLQIPAYARKRMCESQKISAEWRVYISKNKTHPEYKISWAQGANLLIGYDKTESYEKVMKTAKQVYSCSLKLEDLSVTIFFYPYRKLKLASPLNLTAIKDFSAKSQLSDYPFGMSPLNLCCVSPVSYPYFDELLRDAKKAASK